MTLLHDLFRDSAPNSLTVDLRWWNIKLNFINHFILYNAISAPDASIFNETNHEHLINICIKTISVHSV